MMPKDESPAITDLTRGVYRRQYAGYGTGRRINNVSLAAEAWFWRIHSIAADDFGNAPGDTDLLFAATKGRRRDVTVEQVREWTGELSAVDLVRFYEAGGDQYLHVVGFLVTQPAGKNGKRVKRYPHSPWDEAEIGGECIRVNPGESKGCVSGRAQKRNAIGNNGLASGAGLWVNPGVTSASDSDSDSDSDSQNKSAAHSSAASASAATAATFLTFGTVGGKRSKAAEWHLSEDYVSELSEAFPGVDVRAECRKALGWTRAKPANRKTAGGMREFLWKWMSRAQNVAASPSGNGTSRPSREELEAARAERAFSSR